MFEDCKSLNNLNLSNFNTKNVTDMKRMFKIFESFINLEVSNFDTKNFTGMDEMFECCKFNYDKTKFKNI